MVAGGWAGRSIMSTLHPGNNWKLCQTVCQHNLADSLLTASFVCWIFSWFHTLTCIWPSFPRRISDKLRFDVHSWQMVPSGTVFWFLVPKTQSELWDCSFPLVTFFNHIPPFAMPCPYRGWSDGINQECPHPDSCWGDYLSVCLPLSFLSLLSQTPISTDYRSQIFVSSRQHSKVSFPVMGKWEATMMDTWSSGERKLWALFRDTPHLSITLQSQFWFPLNS